MAFASPCSLDASYKPWIEDLHIAKAVPGGSTIHEQVFARDEKDAAGAWIERVLQEYGQEEYGQGTIPAGLLIHNHDGPLQHNPARLAACWASEYQTMEGYTFDTLRKPGVDTCVITITRTEDARTRVLVYLMERDAT